MLVHEHGLPANFPFEQSHVARDVRQCFECGDRKHWGIFLCVLRFRVVFVLVRVVSFLLLKKFNKNVTTYTRCNKLQYATQMWKGNQKTLFAPSHHDYFHCENVVRKLNLIKILQ